MTEDELLIRGTPGDARLLAGPDAPPRRSTATGGSTPVTWPASTPTASSPIVDRTKDIIVSGGENVASREVEEVLHAHPGGRATSRWSGFPTNAGARSSPRSWSSGRPSTRTS